MLKRIQVKMLCIDMKVARKVVLLERTGDCRMMKARARKKEAWFFRPIQWAQFWRFLESPSGATVDAAGPMEGRG